MLTSIKFNKVNPKNSYQIFQSKEVQWNDNPNQKSNDSINNVCTIVENVPYTISVILEHKDRLYLDGIELLPEKKTDSIDTDEFNQKYISKSTSFNLYDNNSNTKYLPGWYEMHLIHNQHDYYSWLHVKSKFLDDYEFNKMVYELESTAEGLSESFKKGYHGITKYKHIRKNDLQLIRLLKKYSNEFMKVIFMLRSNPRSEISSIYKWSYNINSSLDNRSIIKMTSSPKQNKIYGKHHCTNYNIKDNIKLKSDLLKIRHISNYLFKNYGDKFKFLKLYINNIDYFLSNSWMKLVDTRYNYNININSRLMNYNYTFVTNILNKLSNININTSNPYRDLSFNLKSTEHLYEIWGFLKVLESLQELGFKPVSGWLIDDKNNTRGNIIEGLKDDTYVHMINTSLNNPFRFNIQINVVYNSRIPKKEKYANPVWTTSPHNIPDIRLDFFDMKSVLIGSTIIDTKYRNPNNFLKRGIGGSIDQLSSYRERVYAPQIFCSDNYKNSRYIYKHYKRTLAIEKVGAVYPGNIRKDSHVYELTKQEIEYNKKIYGIYPIVSYPGEPSKDVTNFIKININKILNDIYNNDLS